MSYRLMLAVCALLSLVTSIAAADNAPKPLPGWDQNQPSASRFTVLAAFNNEAVRDNNTGLVWERTVGSAFLTWANAISTCANRTVGGTVGWRLPSVIELNSLRDPSLAAPFVPTSVFTGVQSDFYWSATSQDSDPTVAWIVGFGSGAVGGAFKTGTNHFWCVRGPMQESVS